MNKTNKLTDRASYKKLTVDDLKKVIGGLPQEIDPTAEATAEDSNDAKANAKAD